MWSFRFSQYLFCFWHPYRGIPIWCPIRGQSDDTAQLGPVRAAFREFYYLLVAQFIFGQLTIGHQKSWRLKHLEKVTHTVNNQNDQSTFVDHTHADTCLCRPQTYVWHGNLHVRHKRYEMHGFSMLIIYRQCKAQYGTSPTVECKSSQDCSLRSTKCPEHDCLRGREGRSFCTWQVYRK